MYDEKLRVPEGGRAFNFHLRTIAYAVVPVIVTAEQLRDLAKKHGYTDPTELPNDIVVDAARDRAFENTPSLGICCGGGRWAEEPSLELNDEWEAVDEPLQISASPATDAYDEILPGDGD